MTLHGRMSDASPPPSSAGGRETCASWDGGVALANFKYLQLADRIKKDILATVFKPGQQIPIEDELVELFAMSRNTVRQAVKLLVNEGYLIKIQGSGTFVADRLPMAKSAENDSRRRGGRRIGVVMNHVNTYIFPSLLMGISDYLFERDYSLVIRHTYNHIAREEQVLSELLEANLKGLIIEPARSGLPRVNYDLYRRIEETMPCVLMHAEVADFRLPSVTVNDAAGFELLVDYLVSKGHRKIATFCKFDEQTGVKRFLGYAEGLRKHGLQLDEGRILWFADEDAETLFSDANAPRVFSIIDQCTAVLCYNDDTASRFYAFLEKHGMDVPGKLSIAGFDDSIKGGMVPPVTTIVHPKDRFGNAVGKALLDLIADPSANVSLCFPPELVERDSVRDIGKKSVRIAR